MRAHVEKVDALGWNKSLEMRNNMLEIVKAKKKKYDLVNTMQDISK